MRLSRGKMTSDQASIRMATPKLRKGIRRVRTAAGHEGQPVRGSADVHAFWRAAGMLALLNGLLVVWVLLQPAGPRVSPIVSNAAGFVIPLIALPLCFGGLGRWVGWGYPRTEGSAVTTGQRWSPILLGAGILAYAIGQVAFTGYVLVTSQAPPMPSFATIGFLGQYPFLLLGILLLPARTIPVASRTRVALDGLMIMTAAVTFSWYFVLGPVVQEGSQTIIARVLASVYPLADLVLIACLLVLALRPGERALRPAVGLLAAGLLFVVITDGVYGYQRINDIYVTGTILDVGWPVGYALIGLGAYVLRLTPAEALMGEISEGDTSSVAVRGVWRSLLSYALVPVVGLLAFYAWRTSAEGGGVAIGVYIGGGVLICVVLLRQTLTIMDMASLPSKILSHRANPPLLLNSPCSNASRSITVSSLSWLPIFSSHCRCGVVQAWRARIFFIARSTRSV